MSRKELWCPAAAVTDPVPGPRHWKACGRPWAAQTRWLHCSRSRSRPRAVLERLGTAPGVHGGRGAIQLGAVHALAAGAHRRGGHAGQRGRVRHLPPLAGHRAPDLHQPQQVRPAVPEAATCAHILLLPAARESMPRRLASVPLGAAQELGAPGCSLLATYATGVCGLTQATDDRRPPGSAVPEA